MKKKTLLNIAKQKSNLATTSKKYKLSISFLHGFLGEPLDWQPLISYLESDFKCQPIDLSHWDNLDMSILFQSKILIGYSMGGRLALQLKQQFPNQFDHLILLSSHPGLQNEDQKKARLAKDRKWITLLENQPFDHFLQKWYAQPLFKSLRQNESLFKNIMKRRLNQDPKTLIKMLKNYGLGSLPNTSLFEGTSFFYGELDLKYASIYRKLPKFVKVIKIENSGHVIHLENPSACAREIKKQLIK